MKVVNIVLGILILILAVVSTVFSFFLFQKRTGMVEGWDKMAVAISSASAAMDKKDALSKDALAHEKYTSGDMDRNMGKFGKQSKMVVGQRDEFADSMQEMAKSLRMKDAPTAEQIIAADEESPVSSKSIAKEVAKTVKQRDEARKLSADFRAKFNEIGSIVGSSGGADMVVDSVRRCKRNLDRANEDLTRTKRELRNVQSEKNRIESDRDNYKNKLYAANRKNNELMKDLEKIRLDYKLLTKTEYGEVPLWKEGSDEARSKVVGKVIKIDTENGYIVVDLNNTLRVTQQVGSRQYKVDPKIEHGLEMVVCRGNLTGDSRVKFIARIKVASIDNSCMVANIPANAARDIKVGDVVINNAFYEKNLKSESK